MKCPECHKDMKPGVLWLGILSCTVKVLFSPIPGVSRVRRRLAGTILDNGPCDGEVAVLSRDWTDAVSERNSFSVARAVFWSVV